MSELIHKKDRCIMIPILIKDCIKCIKYGFQVRKNRIHEKYEQGILEIQI